MNDTSIFAQALGTAMLAGVLAVVVFLAQRSRHWSAAAEFKRALSNPDAFRSRKKARFSEEETIDGICKILRTLGSASFSERELNAIKAIAPEYARRFENLGQTTCAVVANYFQPSLVEKKETARRKNAPTPLMLAAADGDESAVKKILASGADANARDNLGGTALMYATLNHQTEIVRLLLDTGADPQLSTRKGLTALAIAKNNDFADLCSLLEGVMKSTKPDEGHHKPQEK